VARGFPDVAELTEEVWATRESAFPWTPEHARGAGSGGRHGQGHRYDPCVV